MCIYNINQLSLLLVTTEFQLFQEKNKQTNKQYKCNRWFDVICISWVCKSSSVFFKIFSSTSHSKMFMQCSLRCCMAYATLKYQSNRSLIILPGHLNFWVIECLNSPLPGFKGHSNTPFYVLFK